MARNLTKKQKGFVVDYLKTGNGELSAKNNYDVANDNTARAIASENLTKPNVLKALQDAIPDNLLTERHLELLNKRDILLGSKKEDGTYEKIDNGPEVQAVTKAIDMAYKLKGAYFDESQPRNITPTIIIPLQVSQAFNIQSNESSTNTKTIGNDIIQSEI